MTTKYNVLFWMGSKKQDIGKNNRGNLNKL